jgi:hypothetical protein
MCIGSRLLALYICILHFGQLHMTKSVLRNFWIWQALKLTKLLIVATSAARWLDLRKDTSVRSGDCSQEVCAVIDWNDGFYAI